MSETQDSEPDRKNRPGPFAPGQPLPRLWKTEPDSNLESEEFLEAPEDEKKKAKTKASASAANPASSTRSRSSASKKPEKAKPSRKGQIDPETGEKRVLIEETPRFDTIESRQRVRLVVGGLITFCILMVGWNIYYLLFPASDVVVVDVGPEPPFPSALPPGQSPTREGEASYMLGRARDYARRDQGKPAMDMLKRVMSVYKGTHAAAEAQEALDRQRQNLPLFPTGPVLVAEKGTSVPGAPPGVGTPPPASGPPATAAPTGPPPHPPTYSASTPTQTIVVGPPPNPANPRVPLANGSPVNLNPGVVGPPPAPAPSVTAPTLAATSASLGTPVPPGVPPGQPSMAPATGIGAPRPVTVATTANEPGAANPPTAPPGPGESAIIVSAPTGHTTATAPGGNPPATDRAPAGPGRIVARTLPPGFRARPENGLHESGWPLVIVGERDNAPMVLVPGATFIMGRNSGKVEDGPAHAVHVSTFYIDKHEVTNRQFRAFLQETRYRGQPPGKWLTDDKMRSMPDDAPVVFVSYHDAETYAMWALKRLPTEAQWELAARSVDGRRYPWGDQPPQWSRPRKFHQVDPVGSFLEDVSAYGVVDLAGNVQEWVRDWYDPRFYHSLRGKTTDDPVGPPTKRQGIQRTVRGGSRDWLAYERMGENSDRRLPYLGFRCSLAVEGGEASAAIAPRDEKPQTPKPSTNAPDPGGALPF
ncbi:MAG: formylglycine-generating enzyme family protein [Isosphaeraceae bacterium]